MPNFWLVLDVDFLCHRAFYSTGGLKNNDDPTGVLFGFFRELESLKRQFNSDRFVFCFDHGKLLRESVLAQYKETRKKKKAGMTDEEAENYAGMKSQVKKLKLKYLDRLGYKNVFFQDGYEADDVIASVVGNAHELPDGDRIIMVSADQDLYQLLNKQVAQWNPNLKTLFTAKAFRQKYGIAPRQWPHVKAIAGCDSDDVRGVPGVGEKTACKYLRKELGPGNDKQMMIEACADVWLPNLDIVRLPYPGIKPFKPEAGQRDDKEWEKLCLELDFQTLLGGSGRKTLNRDSFGVF